MNTEVIKALQQRAADSPGGATVEILVEDLESALRDAQRYEALREYLGQLVVHTDGCGIVVLIEVSPTLKQLDPGSVDRALDTLLEREEANERAAALGDQQDGFSTPAAQALGITPERPFCDCNWGVRDQLRPGMCVKCGKRLRRSRR